MKKILCTSLVLLLIISGITAAFATESAKTATAAATGATTTTSAASDAGAANATSSAVTSTESAIVPDMTFTGTPIKLSLEDAYKKMLTDSPGAKMAELNRQSAEGVARGYGESVQSLNDLSKFIRDNKDDPSQAAAVEAARWIYDPSNKNMAKANREFATAQGARNYEAEINSLKTDTLKYYYTVKELENQEKIAKENLELKEKLLANTQLKYKLGTVSKNDVLITEVSVNEARDQYIAATNGLYSMKMTFNQFMGYDLMQNVILTDTINEIPLSSKSLKDSIASALKNRNEIHEAAYNLKMAKFNMDNFKAYPSSSSKYIAAKMALLKAETGYKNAPLTVENDVRTKYMDMHQKYSAVKTGKKSVENAKETLRLTQLQYDAGMATLTDVEAAQIGYYNAQLSLSKTLLEYNLAVNAYELSSGIGVETAIIK